MRNLAAKAAEDIWPEFKVRPARPTRRRAGRLREAAAGVVADYGRKYDSTRSPASRTTSKPVSPILLPTHRWTIRTTNLLESLFVEKRRRLKIIQNAFGERAVCKFMIGALIHAAERWR